MYMCIYCIDNLLIFCWMYYYNLYIVYYYFPYTCLMIISYICMQCIVFCFIWMRFSDQKRSKNIYIFCTQVWWRNFMYIVIWLHFRFLPFEIKFCVWYTYNSVLYHVKPILCVIQGLLFAAEFLFQCAYLVVLPSKRVLTSFPPRWTL